MEHAKSTAGSDLSQLKASLTVFLCKSQPCLPTLPSLKVCMVQYIMYNMCATEQDYQLLSI